MGKQNKKIKNVLDAAYEFITYRNPINESISNLLKKNDTSNKHHVHSKNHEIICKKITDAITMHDDLKLKD